MVAAGAATAGAGAAWQCRRSCNREPGGHGSGQRLPHLAHGLQKPVEGSPRCCPKGVGSLKTGVSECRVSVG